ncbi:MAG: FAD binding domain-containing protein [Oscillospiraceae bacterium]|nr:FAD binding domain-containing protein [Oscillospiraceae bacterium]
MLKFKTYLCPDTIEEALEHNKGRANVVLGGTGWLKMGDRSWNTAIDLKHLGLDQIEETDDAFRVGAMVTLRQLEIHPGLDTYTCGAMRESVRHIVGVQFRNCATVGGTLWGRYGFSDVLTCLMVLSADVVLAKGGAVPLTEFAAMKPDDDILTHLVIRKIPLRMAYASFRNTETDLPTLTAAVASVPGGLRAAIGARPARAERVEAEGETALLSAVSNLSYGSNTRGGGDYRRHLAGVLTRRCLEQLRGGEYE